MTRKSLAPVSLLEAKQRTSRQNIVNAPKPGGPSTPLWPWLTMLFVVGLLVLCGVSFLTWNWLRIVPVSLNTNAVQPQTVTFYVQRTASYADLSIHLQDAQEATSFSDDLIHTGPAVVRLNMQVTNKTNASIAVVYYDIARLLISKQQPVIPSNIQLAGTVQPGATANGWLDFPVPAATQLMNLKLQLGSTALNESLVVIPFTGAFNPAHYTNHVYPQTLAIYYRFKGYTLVYNLKSVDVRYSYAGSQVKAGQQFYVLNWSVDNPNGSDVSPGYGFDYLRLVVNGANRPPFDNTLPYTFKAGSSNTGGRVVFAAPAGMHVLSFGFLFQLSPGQNTYQTNL